MVNLIIKNIQKDNYTLENIENHKIFNLQLNFFDLPNKININDTIIMHKELLDPMYQEYSPYYYFGGLDKEYGRNITNIKHLDVITIKSNKNIYFLKRFFG